jgi:AcrR family transcriptional regulator
METATELVAEAALDPEWATRAKPVTPRGARTRAALIAAARVVFERDGYLDSRLTDITAEAKCSAGTFYTYFSSKEEIFAAVLEATQHDTLHPGLARVDPEDASPLTVIEASHRAYFEAYKRNAKLMMVFEQVAMIDPRFREMRRRRGVIFARRNARAILDLQERGVADPELDPYLTALALNAMVGRLAYHTFALGDDISLEALVTTATQLWANGLKLRGPGKP